jgi:hypothetical protein
MKYIRGEKNDATSIPPKLTTDFMLIMLFPAAVFPLNQLKHVRLWLATIFPFVSQKPLPRIAEFGEKMRQPLAKKFLFLEFRVKYELSMSNSYEIRYSRGFCDDWIHF